MSPVIGEEASRMVVRLKQLCQSEQGSALVPEVVHINTQMQIYTIRVIGRVALAVQDLNIEDSYFGSEEIVSDMVSFFNFVFHRSSFQFPGWLFKYTSLYEYEKKALLADERFMRHCSEHINQSKARLQSGGLNSPAASKGLIDTLIQSVGQDCLTDKELCANVKVMFIAGSETTSSVMSWYLLKLAQNSQWLENLRTEIAEVCGPYSPSTGGSRQYGIVNSEDIATRLPLCLAFFKESMRLYAPAPFLFHTLVSTTESHTLSNGMVIEPSDDIWVHLNGILRDGSVYSNPMEFLPWRWINPTAVARDRDYSSVPAASTSDVDASSLAKMESALVVFGGGPRICPGAQLAYAEALIGLVALIANFDLALACPEDEIHRYFAFTVKPNKLPMHLTVRQ